MSNSTSATYPVRLEVDPAAPQSRLTVFFRIFMLIPHLIVLAFLAVAVEVVIFIVWFIILFTGRFPDGLLRFAIGFLRWNTRLNAYGSLLTGAYPSFSLDDDSAYPVRLAVDEQVSGRNRLTTFFRIFMLIPQVIVLYFVQLAAAVVLFIAWFVALFTGSVPNGMHKFVAGSTRWGARVNAYAMLLVDDYPPFSLD